MRGWATILCKPPMEHEESPGFGTAVIAVLIAGVASSYASALLVGVSPIIGWNASLLVTSLVGAAAARYFLGILGYEIAYLLAIMAIAVGTLITLAITRVFLPTHAVLAPLLSTSGIPSLLLSAWMLQLNAKKRVRLSE
jgi:hypothetical protein